MRYDQSFFFFFNILILIFFLYLILINWLPWHYQVYVNYQDMFIYIGYNFSFLIVILIEIEQVSVPLWTEQKNNVKE